MSAVLALANSIVSDAVRRRIVYVVAAFAVVMAASIPALPSYGIGVVQPVFREAALALMWVASLIVVLALAANRIPSEIEKRTAYSVLTKPVQRWQYVLGTWFGIALVMAGVIAAFTVIDQAVAMFVYKQAMWQLWQGSFGIWMEMSVLAALAVAVSTRGGAVVVAVSSLAFLFIGHSRENFVRGVGNSPLVKLYPSLDAFNIVNPVAHGSGITVTYAATMTLVFCAYVAVFVLLGGLAFSARDL